MTTYRIKLSSAFETLGVINIDWRSIVGQTTLFEQAAITRNLFSKIEQQKKYRSMFSQSINATSVMMIIIIIINNN